ncbi:MAG: LPS assembly lipoprotein LptE [Planctomycetota bacterium]
MPTRRNSRSPSLEGRVLLGWALAGLLGWLGTGCQYSTGPLVSPEYRTVAVPIFQNRTRYREFEFALTREVVNEIERKTHLKVVNERAVADTILTGEISDYRLIPTTENRQDEPTTYTVVLALNLKWTERRTGKTLMDKRNFSQSAEAAFEAGETLETARDEAFRDIAKRIVEHMESEW